MDSLIAETASRVFADLHDDPAGLWEALENTGLTKACIPQTLGGSGFAVADIFGLMKICGGARAPIPYVETLLAGFVLSAAGQETPHGKITIFQEGTSHIPFGNQVKFVLHMPHENRVGLYTNTGGTLTPSIGPDPVSSVDIAKAKVVKSLKLPNWLTKDIFHQLCALARSAQLCGAIEATLEETLAFTGQREQFGRPLTKFQAIQHHLAKIAGESAACSAILHNAIETVSLNAAPDFRALASAKIRTSEAAGIVAAIAHQAHGAIGYTEEYQLGELTRRLWQWREDFGNETYWALRLGRDFVQADSLISEIFGT